MKTIEFPGSLDNFRNFIHNFISPMKDAADFLGTPVWVSSGKERLEISDSQSFDNSAERIWNITLKSKAKIERSASIVALEMLPTKTVINFIDGCSYSGIGFGNSPITKFKFSSSPIGVAFDELFSQIKIRIQELSMTSEVGFHKPKDNSNLNAWFEYKRILNSRGRKYTLEQIAEETGYSYGYIRRQHANWLRQNT